MANVVNIHDFDFTDLLCWSVGPFVRLAPVFSVNIWPKCMRSNWETRMCPCRDWCRRHWPLSDVFERISAHIAIHIHSATSINSSKRWTCEWKILLSRFSVDEIEEKLYFTHAHVSVRTNWRAESTWLTTYIQLPAKLNGNFIFFFFRFELSPNSILVLPWLFSAACGVTYW